MWFRRSHRGTAVWPIVAVFLVAIVAGVTYLRIERHDLSVKEATQASRVGCAEVWRAFSAHESGNWLTLSGMVTQLLPDESGRYQHQRFIVKCNRILTVLIVNDVSIGRRAPVAAGDRVTVRGQYVWNELGGLVHFTHQDPSGGQGGWILLNDQLYSLGSPLRTARNPDPRSDRITLAITVQIPSSEWRRQEARSLT